MFAVYFNNYEFNHQQMATNVQWNMKMFLWSNGDREQSSKSNHTSYNRKYFNFYKVALTWKLATIF